MENLLTYYYGIKNTQLIDNNLLIDDNDYCYLIVEYNNTIDIVNTIKIPNNYYLILKNKDNSFISKYEDKEYVVLQINGLIYENVNLKEIKYNLINNRNYNYTIKNDLADLWSKKIDYLEYQVSELSKNKKYVVNSFSFFAGIGENAISFININNINFNNCHKSIVHSRIKYNEKNIDYYNPLNILIDYEIRDYAEYIKSKILLDDDIINDIKYIINDCDLNIDDIKLFYARLMYPTFYFDLIEDVLLNEKDEKEIEIFIDKIDIYLNTLKDAYYEISTKLSIIIPDWIKSQN